MRLSRPPLPAWMIAPALLAQATAAHATETVTYTYDALGRLTATSVSGGPATGTTSGYTYDPAGNRSQQTVATPLALNIGPANEQLARAPDAPKRPTAERSGVPARSR